MGCGFTQEQQLPAKVHQRSTVRTQRIDCRKKSLQVPDTILENILIIQESIADDLTKVEFAKNALRGHSLFSNLEEDELNTIVNVMSVGNTPNHQYVFKAGDHGSSFMLVLEGSVKIQFKGQLNDKVREKTLLPGDSFGELALMYSAPRAASVKAITSNLKLLVLKASPFKKILKGIKEKNIEKTRKLVDKIKVFQLLSKKQRITLINAFNMEKYPEGKVLFQKGQASHSFYIIESGRVSIKFDDLKKKDLIVRQHQSFGETVFQKDGIRNGTAVALEETTCLVINEDTMKVCLGESLQNIIFHNLKKWALKSSALFRDFETKELDLLAFKFETKNVRANDIVIHEQETIDSVYITLEGSINNQKPGTLFFDAEYNAWYHEKYHPSSKEICEPVNPKTTHETMLVKNDNGAYAQIKFEHLRDVIVTMKQQALKNSLGSRRNSKLRGRSSQVSIGSNEDIELNGAVLTFQELEYLKDLGSGQFGDVCLVKDKKTGTLFALKCLSKEKILKQEMLDCALAERQILSSICHPMIVGYFNSYQDKTKIYFLLEFIDGIEMFAAIREIGILNKIVARYYFGSLLLAIEYLHSMNIIYRDIKPENSLINSEGKVFLIDLGTAKVLKYESNYRTDTMIGTPHYMAPETVKGKGYSFESDYWSLGVVLFEFICGALPFAEKLSDPYHIFQQIRSNQVRFPLFVKDQNAKNLIKKLLTKNPIQRASGGFNWVRQSKYFEGFIWQDLENNRIVPPYIPQKYRRPNAKYKEIQGYPLQEFLRQKEEEEQKEKEKQNCPPKRAKGGDPAPKKRSNIYREWNTDTIE